jgi:hypothetical protein
VSDHPSHVIDRSLPHYDPRLRRCPLGDECPCWREGWRDGATHGANLYRLAGFVNGAQFSAKAKRGPGSLDWSPVYVKVET